ncbi:MAG: hypothetical protein Q4A58_06090 [Fusobacterium sp.]|uniref:hypothetical protein n=1 Tax=Fusobacterium sp. TaxID=68766 RepID=UPI0026DA972D|nr:hypothetical protein [Fusobacterium sp.]MDO4690845.1 hypothetical protein [Fusobacterium sp.]
MKKVLLGLSLVILFSSCTGAKTNKSILAEKYSIDKSAAKDWERTIAEVIISEAELPDWFGEENPLMNLRKHGKLTDKDLYFLESLGKRDESQITDEEYGKFLDILTGYVNGLPRKFVLDDTNIKDPKGLVTYMVRSANSQADNPSKYIKEVVADKYEWDQIIAWSQKNDLDKKEVRKLRKLLNTFMKRDNFFNPQVWFSQEISERVVQIKDLNDKKSQKSKLELNNINAKAMYIAYSEYFSKLDRWSK